MDVGEENAAWFCEGFKPAVWVVGVWGGGGAGGIIKRSTRV